MIDSLVFDIGGTYIRSAKATRDGELTDINALTIHGDVQTGTRDTVWDILEDHIETVCHVSQTAQHVPIIISFPGPIGVNNQILSAPTLVGPHQHYPEFAQRLREATRRDVHLLNDMSAAAWYYRVAYAATRFMIVTVSSGIGSKLFDEQRAHKVIDDIAYAGEIGHIKVDFSPNALFCDCGEQGHLGAIASGRGIERTVNRIALQSAKGFEQSLCHTRFGAKPGAITNESHIVPAAKLGDKWILDIICDCTAHLSRVLSTVYMANGLDRIFLVGGFAHALADVYLHIIQSQMQETLRYHLIDKDHFVQIDRNHDYMPLYGAACYARVLRHQRL